MGTFVSCATTGTMHWRVEMTEAAHPAEFDVRDRATVLPGDAKTGVKDPVIVYHEGQWHQAPARRVSTRYP